MTAAVVVAGVAVGYVAIAWAHHALGAARNDDWAYYRVAFDLADKGTFRLDGWPSMMLIGQTVIAWPVIKVFGEHIAPLQVTVAALAAVALWASYLVIRSFESRGWAALAVACLALGPVYGSLSVSFMTDVPTFAFEALALLAALRALRSPRVSRPWFLVSLGLGLLAFSIREYAVAAGAAVCLVVFWRTLSTDRARLRWYVAASAGWLLLLVALFAWRSSLPHSFAIKPSISLSVVRGSVETAWHAALTLGLFVSPAVLAISPVRLVRAVWDRARAAGLGVVGVALALTALAHPIFVGNYFARIGSYTVLTLGDKPAIVDHRIWDVLGLIGLGSIVAVGLLAVLRLDHVRREPRRTLQITPGEGDGRWLVAVFSTITVAIILAATTITTAPFFDRYFIVLVPFVVALTLDAAGGEGVLATRAASTAAAGLAVLAVIGLLWVDACPRRSTADDGGWRSGSRPRATPRPPSTVGWSGSPITRAVTRRCARPSRVVASGCRCSVDDPSA